MASVYVSGDDNPFIVTESAGEAAEIIHAAILAGSTFAKLTLGNRSDWNAKPLYVRAASVVAISPPKDLTDEVRGEGDD